jgi:two-component system KDP operon response regulator KdpE
MPPTILIVEDNDNIRRFIHTTLDLEGYAVLEAATVLEGLRIAQSEHPALVLLDLALPDGTGWDFLQAMQNAGEPARSKIAILTASADHGMADRGLEAGAVAFITKPISARALVARVQKLLQAQAESKRSE